MTVSIKDIPDSGLSIDHEAVERVASSYLLENDEVAYLLRGVVSNDTFGDYKFLGSIEINCTLVCDKCLRETPFNARSRISEKFSREKSDSATHFEGEKLDFSEVISAGICDLLPMKILCTGDCRGLCSMCGKNLNEESCDCESPVDPRFAVLNSFFKEEV